MKITYLDRISITNIATELYMIDRAEYKGYLQFDKYIKEAEQLYLEQQEYIGELIE